MAILNLVNTSAAKQICFMAALALVTLPVCDGAALAKGKQTTKTRRAHSYFVPPPPAYSPSILPEIQYQSSNQTAATSEDATEKLVEADSADKYVKAKEGYQDPKAVRTNKYVTYWNQK
ncbi:MAG: hypothetical protein JSS83_19645 [Cyanobacteria bacterium SZAS LIN-3]|nr:hypothetical protein [Cyanobacteria bacterium SZAS LIN-3]